MAPAVRGFENLVSGGDVEHVRVGKVRGDEGAETVGRGHIWERLPGDTRVGTEDELSAGVRLLVGVEHRKIERGRRTCDIHVAGRVDGYGGGRVLTRAAKRLEGERLRIEGDGGEQRETRNHSHVSQLSADRATGSGPRKSTCRPVCSRLVPSNQPILQSWKVCTGERRVSGSGPFGRKRTKPHCPRRAVNHELRRFRFPRPAASKGRR